MVRHEAVRPHLNPLKPAPFRQQVQVSLVILLAEENLLPPVAPLRYMVRKPLRHDPRQSGHGMIVGHLAHQVKISVLCPQNYFTVPQVAKAPKAMPDS